MTHHILLLLMLACIGNLHATPISSESTNLGPESISLSIPSINPSTCEHTLQNGLKVIVYEDHRAPMVVCQLWYKVGAAFEHSGITGISHALEHMMFKGTPTVPAGEYSRLIASNGGQHNAFTSHDYTAYYVQIGKDWLPFCLELEADRMANLNFSAEEFAKEMKVVMEERRQRVDDSPETQAKERFFAAAYINNPYQHPAIGWMSDIVNLDMKDVKAWYKSWYGPNNAVLVVVGDVNTQDVFKMAKQYFGRLDPIVLPTMKKPKEVTQLGERRVEVKLDHNVPVLFLGFNVPGIANSDEFWEPYALNVLLLALDGGNSSRFSQNLIRGDKIAASLSSWYNPFTRFSSIFSIVGSASQGNTLGSLEQAILKQIQILQTELLTESELKRIKTKAIAEYVYSQDSMVNQARSLGALEAIGLSWQLADGYVNKIQAVTQEQVQAVARKYLIKDRMVVTELIPNSGGS